MNIQEFFIKWNGKYNTMGSVPNQCVSIIKQYFQDILGIPPIQGNAKDYWKDIPGFERIKKTWYNAPLPGDIVIFNIGEFGHIAICNWSRLFDFGGFEQNFPLGTPCHFQDHKNYKGVIGWLRFKDIFN